MSNVQRTDPELEAFRVLNRERERVATRLAAAERTIAELRGQIRKLSNALNAAENLYGYGIAHGEARYDSRVDLDAAVAGRERIRRMIDAALAATGKEGTNER